MINQGSSLDRALHHDDMNAVRELLEEVGKRGLDCIFKYVYQLVSILEPRVAINPDMVIVSTGMAWLMLIATPEQHARAFIAATQLP